MLHFAPQEQAFVGSAGTLPVLATDAITQRLAMLLEGECQLGPKAAAAKFGLSRQRYFQLRQHFRDQQPQPNQVAGDLVGQQLPHPAFEAGRVSGFRLGTGGGALRVHRRQRLRPAEEFFFAGRSPG